MTFTDHDLCQVASLSIADDGEQAVVSVAPLRLQRHASGNQVSHSSCCSSGHALLLGALTRHLWGIHANNADSLSPASKCVAVDGPTPLLSQC